MSRHYDYYSEDDVVVTDGPPSRPGTSQRRYQPQAATERAVQRIQQRHDPLAGAQVHTRRLRPGEDTSDYTEYLPADQNPYYDGDEDYEDERPRHNPETQRLPIQRASRPAPKTAPRERITDEYPAVQQRPPQQRVRGQQGQPKSERRVTGEVQRVYEADPRQYRDIEPRYVVPADKPARSSRPLISRRHLLFGAGTGIGGAVGIAAGISWIKSAGVHITNQFEEGNHAATSISLICGHHDSETNKTQLSAYVQDDGHINFIELPGGEPSKARIYQTDSIREGHPGYAGELSDVHLTIVPQVVSVNHGVETFQIRLHMEINPVGFFTKPIPQDWILVDSGKGYFVSTNPKK